MRILIPGGSDSGTIWEESFLLGFPAVTLRNAHERPKGVDEATLIMTSLTKRGILDAVAVTLAQASDFRPKTVEDYIGGVVSHKVVRMILSYIDFVQAVVWRKPPLG